MIAGDVWHFWMFNTDGLVAGPSPKFCLLTALTPKLIHSDNCWCLTTGGPQLLSFVILEDGKTVETEDEN